VVTGGGRRVAMIGPTSPSNGAEVVALLEAGVPDEEFEADVTATRRAVLTTDRKAPYADLPGVECLLVG
jgi:hypothetical protein